MTPSPDWTALAERIANRADEIVDLMTLLRDHAAMAVHSEAEVDAIAWAIACASLGDNHLWQDLRLASRGELSALIAYWFPTLAARNVHNMKWKKFFYKELCLREDLLVCRAPSCSVCTDRDMCFGPEDD
jgi:nitrogen fixation protein NifQ